MNPQRAGGRRVPVIGLAGAIGSGKSSVARAFASLGCLVTDSDAQTRAALDRDDVKRQIVSWWGGSVLDASGAIDRSEVARIVFTDATQRERLEALLHPFARRARDEVIERAERENVPAVVIDAPLLFEAGLDAECDRVIFVDAPREVRLRRVHDSRGWDAAEVDRREKAQLPLEDKRRRSDDILVNAGREEDLIPRVEALLSEIRKAFQIGHGSRRSRS
ncbi:MAG: dephospho-CoA kinase [Phycisphaerales bacterium]